MGEKNAAGSCLCQQVKYRITGNMGIFQYCHCSRCRKFTGSAHASNLFVSPDDFSWAQGEQGVISYEPEDTKYFATSFCKRCGSSLPWMSKSGRAVIVPAGTLDEEVDVVPTQNIFCGSKASWYVESSELIQHHEMPPRKAKP